MLRPIFMCLFTLSCFLLTFGVFAKETRGGASLGSIQLQFVEFPSCDVQSSVNQCSASIAGDNKTTAFVMSCSGGQGAILCAVSEKMCGADSHDCVICAGNPNPFLQNFTLDTSINTICQSYGGGDASLAKWIYAKVI